MVLRAFLSSFSLFAFSNLEMQKLAYRKFASSAMETQHGRLVWLWHPHKTEDEENPKQLLVYPTVTKHARTRTVELKAVFFFLFFPNHMDAQLLRQDSSPVTLQCHLQINIWFERGLEINGEVVKTGVHCCDAGRARGRRRISLSVSSLHVQHTWDKQHVWFLTENRLQKSKKQVDIPFRIKKKRVHNDDNERWSLYTKKARTLRPCLFVCLFPSFWSPVLFETVDGSTEAPRCNSSKERSDCKDSRVYSSQNQSHLSATAEAFLTFSGDWDKNLLEYHRDPFWYFPVFLVCCFLYAACFCFMESFDIYLSNQTQTLLFPRGVRCIRWQMVAVS